VLTAASRRLARRSSVGHRAAGRRC
jgi:hypothetical protein